MSAPQDGLHQCDVAALTLSTRLSMMARAAGSAHSVAAKWLTFAGSLARMSNPATVAERVARLRRLGYVASPISTLQLALCAVDMFRFWVKDPSPEAIAFYERTKMSWSFHQLLRWLQEPAAMIDPMGLFSAPEVVIAHLLQVVHANPWYDLQLLHSHDALDPLEVALLQVIDGTHPNCATIAAVIECDDYHQALLDQVRAFRDKPRRPPPLRDHMPDDFRLAEQTFGELSATLAYASRLPDSPRAALDHLSRVAELRDSPALAPELPAVSAGRPAQTPTSPLAERVAGRS